MIQGFRHKGLKLLFENGDRRKVHSQYADKIERILARLEAASEAEDMDLPGFRLHPLKGEYSGFWSVSVSANWRIIFRLKKGHADDVDLIDYH